MNQGQATQGADEALQPEPEPKGRIRAAWDAVLAVIGAFFGLLPHLLHHIGPLAGAAIVGGATGTILFSVVAFGASLPILLRLRRRFGTWRAPAIGLGVFVAMFAMSTFVIGPAIRGESDNTPSPEHDVSKHEQHKG